MNRIESYLNSLGDLCDLQEKLKQSKQVGYNWFETQGKEFIHLTDDEDKI